MNNCIFNDNDESNIGYYKDLKAGLKDVIKDHIEADMLEKVNDKEYENA